MMCSKLCYNVQMESSIRNNETAETGWETFEHILPSQMRPGSKIRITTASGSVYVFEALGGKQVRIISSSSETFQGVTGKILGGFKKGKSAVVIGFRGNEYGTIRSSAVSVLEGMGILPDTNTAQTIDLLKKYFPKSPDDILQRTVIQHEVSVSRVLHRVRQEQPEVIDFSTPHAKVTAAILDLFSRIDHDRLGFDAKTLETIGRTFSTFIKDHEMDFGHETIQNIERDFVLDTAQGQKRYKMNAVIGTDTHLVIDFTLVQISGVGSVN